MPGDKVGTAEEYLPSFGVFSEGSDLYSSNTGALDSDPRMHSIRVKVSTRIPRMQSRGTVVIGLVTDVSDVVAFVDLAPFESKNFVFVPQGLPGILHVSAVCDSYVEDIHSEIRVSDIVRVKILEVTKFNVKLTTAERFLGAIKAFCTVCHSLLQRDGNRLVCVSCGRQETRKMAEDYGSGALL